MHSRVIGKIKYHRILERNLYRPLKDGEVRLDGQGCKVCDMAFKDHFCILEVCNKETLCEGGHYAYLKANKR